MNRYKYRSKFEAFTRGRTVTGTSHEEREELNEVYRKAEAFDKLMMYFEKSSMRSAPELYFHNSADTVFEEYYESEEPE